MRNSTGNVACVAIAGEFSKQLCNLVNTLASWLLRIFTGGVARAVIVSGIFKKCALLATQSTRENISNLSFEMIYKTPLGLIKVLEKMSQS